MQFKITFVLPEQNRLFQIYVTTCKSQINFWKDKLCVNNLLFFVINGLSLEQRRVVASLMELLGSPTKSDDLFFGGYHIWSSSQWTYPWKIATFSGHLTRI